MYSQNWATPDWLYDELDNEFNFDFDPCPRNSKFDGLKVPWGKSNYVNPPYLHDVKIDFIRKAIIERELNGSSSVFLLPVSTGGEVWHDYIEPFAKEYRFLRGYLKFENFDFENNPIKSKYNHAPFYSMIVVF